MFLYCAIVILLEAELQSVPVHFRFVGASVNFSVYQALTTMTTTKTTRAAAAATTAATVVSQFIVLHILTGWNLTFLPLNLCFCFSFLLLSSLSIIKVPFVSVPFSPCCLTDKSRKEIALNMKMQWNLMQISNKYSIEHLFLYANCTNLNGNSIHRTECNCNSFVMNGIINGEGKGKEKIINRSWNIDIWGWKIGIKFIECETIQSNSNAQKWIQMQTV